MGNSLLILGNSLSYNVFWVFSYYSGEIPAESGKFPFFWGIPFFIRYSGFSPIILGKSQLSLGNSLLILGNSLSNKIFLLLPSYSGEIPAESGEFPFL